MKVLFVGNYADGTGYSQAGTEYILALDAAGVEVVPRRLKLNEAHPPIHPRILELEDNSPIGSDTVIQHSLPPLMDYHGSLRCIGLFASETSRIPPQWAESLNRMDEVWIINRTSAGACRDSGVKRTLRVIPHAVDTAKFETSHKPLPQVDKLRQGTDFLFYTVGEFTRRKNFGALLRAFHAEFRPEEPVRLVVKTGRPGVPPKVFAQEWAQYHRAIVDGLGIFRHYEQYAQPLLLPERLSEEEMNRLHSSCDCFVSPSHGEAGSLPALDAMGFGKTPVVTGWGGFLDYVSEEEGWLVNSRLDPCFAGESLPGLYSAHEKWAVVEVDHLRKCLREVYERADLRQARAERGLKRVYDFSRERIGLLMKVALESPDGRQVDPVGGQG